MAVILKTAQELKDMYLGYLEGAVGQQAPLFEKAFLQILSVAFAFAHVMFQKFGAERVLQNLVKTATGAGLVLQGEERNVIKKPAEAAALTATIPGTELTVIDVDIDFVGVLNNIRYSLSAQAVVVGGVATLDLTAQAAGVIGNLNIGDFLSIGTPVAGVGATATVTEIINVGAEEEEQEAHRSRIQNIMWTILGGGNHSNYKTWAEEVAGVFRAYPFSGKPFPSAGSFPADRTVYIEADSTIDPDGIPPQALLDEVRIALNTDPITGLSRPPLGLIDDTLFVEAIIRTGFYVTVLGLNVLPAVLAETRLEIESALTVYFFNTPMFVGGIDLPQDRRDTFTILTVGEVVQDVISSRGGVADRVIFGIAPGGNLGAYTLDPGELAKLIAVAYE